MFDNGVFTAYSDGDVCVSVQPIGDDAHLHCLVYKWSPSVLRRLYEIFAWLERSLGDAGFKRLVTVTPNPKFAKLFGGTYLGDAYYHGVKHEVIVWELQQQLGQPSR